MRRFFLVLLFIFTPVIGAAQTDDDPGYLAGVLQDALSDAGRDVRIVGFEGALSSRATIREMSIADEDGIWFRAENILLDWNRAALLRGRIEVNSFGSDRIDVFRAPVSETDTPTPEAQSFAIPELPVSISIAEIRAPEISLGPTLLGEELTLSILGSAELAGGAADVTFDAKRTRGPEGTFRIDAAFDPTTRVAKLDLLAREASNGITARLLDIPNRPSLELAVQGDAPIDDFVARLRLLVDGSSEIAGTFRLANPDDVDGWVANLDVSGSPTSLIQPELQPFFGDQFSLQANASRSPTGELALSEFTLATGALNLSGEVSLGSDGWPRTMSASGLLADPENPSVLLPFGDNLRVGQAEFTLDYDRDVDDGLSLNAHLVRFDHPEIQIDSVALAATGTIAAPGLGTTGDLSLRIDWDAKGIDATDPAIDQAIGDHLTGEAFVAYQSDTPIELRALRVEGSGYRLFGDAFWNSTNALPLRLDLALQADDLSRFAALANTNISGFAQVDIAGELSPLSGAFDVTVAGRTRSLGLGIPIADRAYAGQTQLRVEASRDVAGLHIPLIRAETNAIDLDASAELAGAKATLNITSAKLGLAELLGGDASGTANVTGKFGILNGHPDIADLNIDISNGGQSVRLPFAGGLTLANGRVTAEYNRSDGQVWSLSSQLKDVTTPDIAVARIDTHGQGSVLLNDKSGMRGVNGTLHTTTQGVNTKVANLRALLGPEQVLNLTFQWDQPYDRLSISNLSANSGDLSLGGDVQVTSLSLEPNIAFDLGVIAPNLNSFSDLVGRTLRGGAELSARGTYASEGGFDIDLSGQTAGLALGMSRVDDLLRPRTSFDAGVTGNGTGIQIIRAEVESSELSLAVNGPIGRIALQARINNISRLAPDFQGAVSAEGVIANALGTPSVDVSLLGPGGTAVKVSGTVPSSDNLDLRITGDTPLGLVNGFIEPRRLDGRALLDLRLNGAASLSSLTGTVTPVGAGLSAPTLAMAVSPINGLINLSNGVARLDLNGSGNAGGSIGINGTVGLHSRYRVDLVTAFRQFGIRDPNLYETAVTGQLAVTGPLTGGASIRGNLALGETNIAVPDSGVTALSDIPPIGHIAATRPVMRTLDRAGISTSPQTSKTTTSGSALGLDILITAPGRLFVRGRGLDAELGGSLRLGGTTSQIIPSGGFELVRGRLDILNQRFALNQGRIQLSGSFDAILYFVATTDANGITITITLDGPISSPAVKFSSSPDLPEDEVISQLLYGRDLSNISPLQALELASAVATLAGRGGGGVLSRLREGFGLDDLDVTQSEGGGTAVRAGKYLSDNIYSDVVVSSDGQTEINLNLDITPNLTARGSADNTGNSSLGIFFEKDY